MNGAVGVTVMIVGFEERTKERGKIATFVVPQLRVLRHPACGAFLNHCGWNTVLESLAGGVPIIAWPRQFEQRMTARLTPLQLVPQKST